MSTRDLQCSLCESTMEQVPDIVDEIISEAVQQRAAIHHISGTMQLAEKGGVGSVLRFHV